MIRRIAFVTVSILSPSFLWACSLFTFSLLHPIGGVAPSFAVEPTENATDPAADILRTFDPKPDRGFIFSVVFVLERIPPQDTRNVIASKLAKQAGATVGWGLFLKRYATSVRPEVHWQSRNVKVSMPFERYDFKPRIFYALTLVAKPREYLGVYLQPLGPAPLFQDRFTPSSAETELQKHRSGEKQGERTAVLFLGGADLAEKDLPSTTAPLQFAVGKKNGRGLAGWAREALVGYPKSLPRTTDEFLHFLDGGPSAIAARLSPEEIGFSQDLRSW